MSRLTVLALLAGTLLAMTTRSAASHAAAAKRAGTIAFLRDSGSTVGLFTVKADGTSVRRLSPSGANVASYEWSPDGTRLAYLDRQGALWITRPGNTQPEQLAASSPKRSPWFLSWSREGNEIAVLAQDPAARSPYPATSGSMRNLTITIIPVDGRAPRRLPPHDVGALAWSPKADQIVYTTNARMWEIRSDGSGNHPLHIYNLGEPTWSPDGTRLAFGGHVRRRTGRSAGDFYAGIDVADANGHDLHRITSHADNEYGFVWSPDGRWILYGREQQHGIYLIDPHGRHDHRLTTDPPLGGESPALSWSPDGRSIAYRTYRTGNGDIYLIDANGHNKTRLTSTTDTDVAPSWQPHSNLRGAPAFRDAP